jgi:16S rRNA (guanine527-N7)-methyltransferase
LEKSLRDGLISLGVAPSSQETAALAQLLRLLERWNHAFNLTAVRSLDEMVALHVLDSISARPFLRGSSVLDVGTGAGFPGLPLAILEPDRQFSLLDSGGKKARFVRHAVGELGIANVVVVHARAEEYEPDMTFDTIICRAFSSVERFVARCGHLAAEDGRMLAMKGRSPDDELHGLRSPWETTEVAAVKIPGLAVQRHIVILERTGPAPEKRSPHAG